MTPGFGGMRRSYRQILKQRFLLVQYLGVKALKRALFQALKPAAPATCPVHRRGADPPALKRQR